MALPGREIKNRLRSIKNSKKITKAMELVSAAKMRRAVMSALNTRTYAHLLWDIITRIVTTIELTPVQPIRRFFKTTPLASGQKEKVMLVVFTSNRGLCGAFNANVMKKVVAFVNEHGRDHVQFIVFGKKGVSTLNHLGIKAEFAYQKDDVAKSVSSVTDMAEYIYEQFRDGQTNRVMVAYTDYRSAVLQVPTLKQLFPLEQADSVMAAVDNVTDVKRVEVPNAAAVDYLYEPSKLAVLEYIVPRLTEVQLYQALLESNASEHSARMLAMKNATDAAADMIDELILAFNRARQASITKEIAEISAGSAAVS